MIDLQWTDGAFLTGVAGVCTALGAVAKTLFDARVDRGKARTDSEDLVREDLRAIVQTQGGDLTELRRELADARRELREFQEVHLRSITEWQEKYNLVYRELVELKAYVKSHGLIPDRNV